ncbi:hypothetical protein [Conexibacter sp. CPCC 206217]|uniref:hypothetical protein n=1 Tax=Conexibacter sp. CPCC 206217 TaxID=3064574 RepID=UPI002720BA23|nr:hypothetical protein [Conexibacter sp. CPCC 206217]MDO8212947.1 hypothetical protein [Conexibacter sp. CPCC 206217]
MSVAEQPVAFFVPRLDPAQPEDEVAYAALRQRATDDAGCAPRDRRIFRLWCRRGGRDCVLEVGKPDPVHGQVVLAIFDLGRGQPYVVHSGLPGEEETAVREHIGRHVYAVTEFADDGADGRAL